MSVFENVVFAENGQIQEKLPATKHHAAVDTVWYITQFTLQNARDMKPDIQIHIDKEYVGGDGGKYVAESIKIPLPFDMVELASTSNVGGVDLAAFGSSAIKIFEQTIPLFIAKEQAIHAAVNA